jgi:hypothetical protein
VLALNAPTFIKPGWLQNVAVALSQHPQKPTGRLTTKRAQERRPSGSPSPAATSLSSLS